MKNTAGPSRRAFLRGASATVALSAAPAALRAAAAPSDDEGLSELSAADAVGRMSRGELTAEHYARALLKRCAAGHALDAFIALEPERVLEDARRRDRERRAGAKPGALFGLPIPIKDCANTRDYATSGGTPGLRHFRPRQDAPLIDTLRRAGAIVLGKTNMHELGYGWTSNNESFGAVRNPYDPARIAGGSSGGTGAAVAARMAPLGVGEDTNGSIRIPAALCGVTGLRPTTGRYSTHGCIPISPVFDQLGPLARTVGDLALFDAVITGDLRPLEPAPLVGVRLGVVRDYWYRDLDPELERVTSAALARLTDAGVVLVESQFPQLARLHESITTPIITHDIGPAIARYLKDYGVGLSFEQLVSEASPGVRADLRQVFPGGSDFVSDADYRVVIDQKLPEMRRLYREYFVRTGVSALVFPATAVPALPVGAEGEVGIGDRRISLFTALARNITPAGSAMTPGLVLPAGLTSSGLPVALELDAPPGSDRSLLALGVSVAQLLGPLPAPRLPAPAALT